MESASLAMERDAVFGFDGNVETDARVRAPKTESKAFDESSADIDLCRLAANGNIAAFELIYTRYHRRTYSLTLRMTSNQTEAEDLTQEVFIQLFRKIGSFRGDWHSQPGFIA